MINLKVVVLVVFVGIVVCVFLVPFVLFANSIDSESYSKIVYNLCAGVGTFLGGLGVIRYLDDYLKQKDKVRDTVLKQYPYSKYREGWDVIAPSDDKGRIFIRDLEKDEVHHVGNYLTYLDLGLGSFKTEMVDRDIFIKYKEGLPIYTLKETDNLKHV